MSAEANSDQSEQRNQETVLAGQRRKGYRSQLRAYNFLKKKAIQNGIPFPEFEPRENSAGKPTARSQNWKKQQQLKQAANGETPDKLFCELQSHTADCVHSLHLDEPSCSWENRTAESIVSNQTVGMSAGTHSHNSEQRNQEAVQDGQRPIGSRNQLRAYNFQKKRAIENGIPFREFEPREKSAGKPTARSQNWKKQQQLKWAEKGKTPDKPFCELQSHTADCVDRLDLNEPSCSWRNRTAEIIVSKKSVGMSAGTHFHNSKQSNQDAVQYGQRPMGFHNQIHTYNFQKKRAFQNGIPFPARKAVKGKNPYNLSGEWQSRSADCLYRLDPDDNLENRTAKFIVSKRSFGKPTARSQNWKKQQQLKQASEASCSDKPFCKLQSHSALLHRLDSNMPYYNLGNCTVVNIESKKSSGKPTARSQNWKKQQQLKQAIEVTNPDKQFYELQSHTANCVHRIDPKESSYNLGPMLLSFQFPKHLLESQREEPVNTSN